MRVSIVVSVCAAAVLLEAISSEQPARAQEKYDRTRAAAVFTNACSKCHPVEKVVAVRRTRFQWEEVMTQMTTARGAQVADHDWDVILDYLVKEHGRVDVNRAPAEELVDVLEIEDASASAIVRYRKEHGPFKDFDALLKVPGIDAEKLKKKRDAIAIS